MTAYEALLSWLRDPGNMSILENFADTLNDEHHPLAHLIFILHGVLEETNTWQMGCSCESS